MDENKKVRISVQSQISYDELRMKQSVRTTFKLPKEISDLLALIAGQLGIKQKSLLDQLTADAKLLEKLAREALLATDIDENRHSKTYVMSRSSLRSLNDVAKRQKIPRDILVEVCIKRLLPIIETELERHIERKKILKEMKDHMHRMEALRNRAEEVLGEDDELYAMLDKQAELQKKNIAVVITIIKNGMPMEEW